MSKRCYELEFLKHVFMSSCILKHVLFMYSTCIHSEGIEMLQCLVFSSFVKRIVERKQA